MKSLLFSPKGKAALAALAVIAACGLAAWIYQLGVGLGATGMNNSTSWGAYITMFMLFVGLSAGGLIVASSASVFHAARFKRVALPAIILSTVCICVATAFVLVDLGGIARVWRLLTGPNPSSPLFWDVCVISAYLAVNVVYLVLMRRHGADSHQVEIASRFALPIAILVHSVTAWIFGLQVAREWYTAIMAPIFVASAMDSGLALLIVALLALDRAGVFEFPRDLMSSLAGLLAAFVAVDAFLIGCEILTMAYPGGSGAEALAFMAAGPMAPYFWFEIVCGLAAPFAVLVFAKNRSNTRAVAAASALVVLGVFCKRVWLLFTGFSAVNVAGSPGIPLGSVGSALANGASWSLVGAYSPTLIEIAVVAGVIAVGAIAFAVMCKALLPKGRMADSQDYLQPTDATAPRRMPSS